MCTDIHADTDFDVVCCLQEGDPEGWWEETFNGHTDSKPSGPEAISIDLKFPGYKHVYGLPERATNFSLQPTAGVCKHRGFIYCNMHAVCGVGGA
jgi:hypothetical protein